jgi:hypothetical protein
MPSRLLLLLQVMGLAKGKKLLGGLVQLLAKQCEPLRPVWCNISTFCWWQPGGCVFWCVVFSINSLDCAYISALSGSTLMCRVTFFLGLSEVPLFEPVARSVRIQLAVRACCSVAGWRCQPQLGIEIQHPPADEYLFVMFVYVACALYGTYTVEGCICVCLTWCMIHSLIMQSNKHTFFMASSPVSRTSDQCQLL